MNFENIVTYERREMERREIISKIEECDFLIEEYEKKVKNFRAEINDLEEQVKIIQESLEDVESKKHQIELEKKYLEKEYSDSGIPVPDSKDFNITDGLLGMKRDLNLKLVKHLSDDKIRQVFFL
jgi:hypothetical protein